MHVTKSMVQLTSQDTEGYDDCGISICTVADNSQQVVEYPINVKEFISGLFYSSPNSRLETNSADGVINNTATIVEQNTEALEETSMIGWNFGITQNITYLFKTSLELAVKSAEQLAEIIPSKTDFYEAVATVTDLASSVINLDEEQEQQAKDDVAELEDDFEQVAEVAELVREATQGTNNTKTKLNLT